jgi:hypothetical protein
MQQEKPSEQEKPASEMIVQAPPISPPAETKIPGEVETGITQPTVVAPPAAKAAVKKRPAKKRGKKRVKKVKARKPAKKKTAKRPKKGRR